MSGIALVPTAAQAATAAPARATAAGVPAASALVAVKAKRLADTAVKAGKVATFTVLGVDGVPKTGVAAVAVKLTASKPAAAGALVAYPTGAKRPGILSVSFAKGHDTTAVVVVVPGSKGRVSAANLSLGGVRVIPTVVGYYRAATATSASLTYFKAVAPRELVSAKLAAAGSVTLNATGHGVPATATGVVVELSALSPVKSGSLTLSPAGVTSKVNALAFTAGHNATNTVTVATGTRGRIVLLSKAKGVVRVRVDVVGYLVPLAPAGGAPGGFTVVGHAGGALLTWTAARSDAGSPVLHYAILVSQLLPEPTSRIIVTTGPVLSFDVTGLTSGVAYTFQVYAVTREGPSAPTAAVTVTPVAPVALTVPAAPTGVTAVANGPGSVKVTWVAPVSDGGSALTGYVLTGGHAGPVTLGPTVTTYTYTGLTVGQQLTATVVAVNAVGSSLASAASGTVIVPGTAGELATTPVSVDSAGGFHGSGADPSVTSTSSDGRYVVFVSASAIVTGDSNGVSDVFLRDRVTGLTTRISSNPVGDAGDHASQDPAITPDGRYVVFDSFADDLVAGDTNAREDVFVRDTTTNTTTQVSLTDTGAVPTKASLSPAISADGRYVTFLSNAPEMITGATNPSYNVFVRDVTGATTTAVSRQPGTATPPVYPAAAGVTRTPTISADGRYIAYSSDDADLVAGDTNGTFDTFVYDQTTGVNSRVSVGPAGVQGNGASGQPSLSSDGHYAVFPSDATNLVAGDTNAKTDIFVRDLVAGTTTRVSLANDGSQANDVSSTPTISADGTRVAFTSSATNLVTGDTNAVSDAFVRYLSTGETIRVSVSSAGSQLAAASTAGAISPNGLVVLFGTPDATLGGAADTNAVTDLFARTLG